LSEKILVATRNKGKLVELLRIFQEEIPGIELLTLDAFPGAKEVEESGETFEANSLLKAEAAFELSGLPSLADDSGLIVDALGGAPGVHSARYSGSGDIGNIERVLHELRELGALSEGARTARFVTVATYIDGDGTIVMRGELEGVILPAPRGDGGFGYDPIFKPLGSDLSLAEMAAHEKDAISHRGRALRLLAPKVGLRFRHS
jgi:XTP/dITP diphosphohydrolase